MSPELTPMLNRVVLRDPAADEWLTFSQPVEVLAAERPSAALSLLEEAERCIERDGLFAVGYVSYEAAPAFDRSYRTRAPTSLPVLCFGLFSEPHRARSLPELRSTAGEQPLWRITESRACYFAKIEAIRDQLAAGNTYQINYTVRQVAESVDDPFALFALVASDAPYAAYLEMDDHAIVSASPELFFEMEGTQIRCRPMKGTARRGTTLSDDRAIGDWLARSDKNRAENVMITDMVRNDLGRIAQPGSVRVSSLCEIERYPTVFQMTSTVEASTNASVSEVFRALFPSASVTGAPKVSSMRLIAALEDSPRGVYTGAIGMLSPGHRARFNVAIRTAVVDTRTGDATYGVGSGIVADSDPAEEYAECLVKGEILTSPPAAREFGLLETMLWTPAEGIFLLDYHLSRLRDSAEYFGFPFDDAAIARAVDSLTEGLTGERFRVRLILEQDGRVVLEHQPVTPPEAEHSLRLKVAAGPIDTDDPFLYHKTTRRGVYERAMASVVDSDDVLLWNANGFVTETSTSNIVANLDGRWITPPVRCGLLGGTYRQWLLDRREVEEAELHLDQLPEIEALFLVNSVRGKRPARICG